MTTDGASACNARTSSPTAPPGAAPMDSAIAILSEIDLVGIGREDFLLAVVVFENQRNMRFPELALDAAFTRQVKILDELLRDGAATFGASLEKRIEKRTQGTPRIDTGMAVETPVLDREQCLLEQCRNLLVAEDDAILVVAWVDTADLQRLETHEIDLLSASALPQGFHPVIPETHIEGTWRFLAIPEAEGTAVDEEPVAVDGPGAGSVSLRVLAITEHFELCPEALTGDGGAGVEFQGAGIHACGHSPALALELLGDHARDMHRVDREGYRRDDKKNQQVFEKPYKKRRFTPSFC